MCITQERSPEQWQALVEAQAASGQSQAAFCAAHGVSKSSFQIWKRRLRASSATQHAPQAAADCDVTLDLGDGMCLRVRRVGS